MDEKVLDSGRLNEKKLIELAHKARKQAYTPYSHFQVGAALVTKQGKVYPGCNIENASYTPSNCAERTAFFKAVSEGEREFEAIAVVSSEGEAWPCGICRQFMKEFCDDDFKIITGDDADSLSVYTMDEILPEGFRL